MMAPSTTQFSGLTNYSWFLLQQLLRLLSLLQLLLPESWQVVCFYCEQLFFQGRGVSFCTLIEQRQHAEMHIAHSARIMHIRHLVLLSVLKESMEALVTQFSI